VVNIIVWAFQIVVMVWLSELSNFDREQNILYNTNMIGDVILSFLVSLGFLVYGLVWARMRYLSDISDPKRIKDVFKILASTTTFSICFLLRVIMYLWRFIFKTNIHPDLFVTLAYYIPEFVSVSLQVYMVESSKSTRALKNQYITDLYAGEADCNFEEDQVSNETTKLVNK